MAQSFESPELRNMIARAQSAPRHIVLAEGHDPRIIKASVKAMQDKLATITLLGQDSIIRPLARLAGDRADEITLIDPNSSDKLSAYTERYYKLRRHKGIRREDAQEATSNPLNFANMMVRCGHADGSVAGAITPSTDVVRSALHLIGKNQNADLVSSLFVMIMPPNSPTLKGSVIYADCGLVIDPSAQQLASIAVAASDNATGLLGLAPKVAMLSFATKDSAKHAHVDKVRQATEIVKAKRPDLNIDGPLQFDAAILPDIAKRKAPGSPSAGQANVFIFPDLDAGNIAYKITQRLGCAQAIGPILQGLDKPANDLSRGCDAQDIYNMIAVTAIQAHGAKQRPTNE